MLSDLLKGLFGKVPYTPVVSGTEGLSLAAALDSEQFAPGTEFEIDFGDTFGRTLVIYQGADTIPVLNTPVHRFNPRFDENISIYLKDNGKVKYWKKF